MMKIFLHIKSKTKKQRKKIKKKHENIQKTQSEINDMFLLAEKIAEMN